MSRINMAVLLVLGLLLVTAKQSTQMSLRNPTAEIETSNCKLPLHRVGLVLASDTTKGSSGSGLVTNISYVDMSEFEAQNKGQLAFGHFNYPVNGENLLGTAAYENITLYSPSEDPEEVFWLPVPLPEEAATEELTKGLKFKECHSGRCQAEFATVYRSKASTSDFYHTEIPFESLSITADSASAVVALLHLINLVNEFIGVLIFRHLSNESLRVSKVFKFVGERFNQILCLPKCLPLPPVH
uniref:Uncharacterized protein n=1 Tax=Salix viminalis TaxID=40686 RepID=A0A6N2MF08_SALVM